MKTKNKYKEFLMHCEEFQLLAMEEQKVKVNKEKLVVLRDLIKGDIRKLNSLRYYLDERRSLARELGLGFVSMPLEGFFKGSFPFPQTKGCYFDETGKEVPFYKYEARKNPDGWARGVENKVIVFRNKDGEYLPIKDISKKNIRLLKNAGNFSEGFAWIQYEGMFGFIDKQGNSFPKEGTKWFDTVSNFHEGMARVQEGSRWCYLSKEGKLVPSDWNKRYKSAETFKNGVARVETVDKGWGLIDKEGNFTPTAEFAEEEEQFPKEVYKDGKYYFQNKDGTIFPENHKDWYDGTSGNFVQGIIMVEKDGENYNVDINGERFP